VWHVGAGGDVGVNAGAASGRGEAGVRRKGLRSRAGGGAEDRGRRRVGEEDDCLSQTQVMAQKKGLTLLPHHDGGQSYVLLTRI
jgi:hypothetical protein